MSRRNRRSRRSAANIFAHTGADAGQTIGLAGDHRTRGFPSHADGLGPVSSYALSQPNSTMTSSGGCDMLGHGGQANFSVVSAWSQPLRVAEAPQVSKKDVVTKMPFRQSTQQHLLRTDPPIAQAKPAPKLGKKAQRSKPLRIAEAPQVSKKDVATKMSFHQSHLLRTDPPIAQAKPAPKLGKKAQRSKPLRIAETPQVSKKDVVTKMSFHQSHLLRTNPPIAQAKPAPKSGKKAQQANLSVVSAWPKPLRIAEAPHVSKKDVVTKMPFRQSTQQHLLRTDPPAAQAKFAPKLGKMTQQANFSVVSAWSKPLRIAEALQVSKNDVVTKMPLRQSTQQHLLRTDPPIAQAKPAPKLGKKAEMKVEKKAETRAEKKAEKKKRKPFYKEVKKEIRGPAYWKKKAEEDACLLNSARGIWRHEVRKKAAEYRRRIVAKKCKRHRPVSPKWMEEKEGKNRGARHKKQDQRQFFVNFNKAYEDKLRVERRREQVILRSAGGGVASHPTKWTQGGECFTCPLGAEGGEESLQSNEKNAGRELEDKDSL